MLIDRRWILSSLLALSLIPLAGCPLIGGNAEKPVDEAISEEGDEEPAASEAKAVFDIKPKPVVDNYRPLQVTSPDGLKLEGTLYVPGLSPYKAPVVDEEAGAEEEAASEEEGTAAKPKVKIKRAKVQYPLVILLHSLSSSRWEWKEYPRHLLNAGYAVLAIDMRGHGESVYKGKTLNVWRQFDDASWQKLADDPQVFLDHIAQQPDFNMVNTHSVGIIGASLGANVGVNYASKHPQTVKALVLLSPGLEYHGIETFTPLTHYENPVYFLASSDDAYSADSVKRLYKFALGKKKIKIFEDLGHGVDMMAKNPDLGKDMRDWMVRMLPPVVGAQTMDEESPAASEKESDKAKDSHSGEKDKVKGAEKATDSKDNKELKSKPGEKTEKPKAFEDPTRPNKSADTSDKAKSTTEKAPSEKTLPEKPLVEKTEPVKTPVVRKKPVVNKATTKPAAAEKPAAEKPVSTTPAEPSQAAPPPPPPPAPSGN